jgi:hypothetical protein
MNEIKELQHSLSQLIYSISDFKSLSQIKNTVDNLIIIPTDQDDKIDLPWADYKINLKPIIPFKEVVRNQGQKKLTFEELYPLIDDSDDDYNLEMLLSALN